MVMKEGLKMFMWRVVVCLVLILTISLPAVAGEDKPQADRGSATGEKGAAERSSSEIKTSDKGGTPSKADAGLKKTEEATGPPKADSHPSKAESGTGRDFLRLAEPKSLTEKKRTPKNIPWGGYWGAVYRRSPDEEEGPPSGELESKLPAPGGPESVRRPSVAPPEKPPSLAEYQEVEFARFASGSYASDYGGKYLKFHCRFASLAPEGMRLHDFPPPEYLNFTVVGLGSSMESLTVVARAELGDRIFRTESGKEITLYGRAHRLSLSGLTLVVDEIEPRK